MVAFSNQVAIKVILQNSQVRRAMPSSGIRKTPLWHKVMAWPAWMGFDLNHYPVLFSPRRVIVPPQPHPCWHWSSCDMRGSAACKCGPVEAPCAEAKTSPHGTVGSRCCSFPQASSTVHSLSWASAVRQQAWEALQLSGQCLLSLSHVNGRFWWMVETHEVLRTKLVWYSVPPLIGGASISVLF